MRGRDETRVVFGLVSLALLGTIACHADRPEHAPLEYPSFEFASSSRMFGLIGSDLDKIDLTEIAKSMDKMGSVNDEARAMTEQLSSTPKSSEPTAELLPEIPLQERSIYTFVPLMMMKLEPLWHVPTWSSEQVELAKQAATILARIDGAPQLEFGIGDDAGNRNSFEVLVRWFHAVSAKPETLAAMIFTLDDGPFVGLPYSASSVLPAAQRARIDVRMELILSKVEREDEPWVMQCVRDGKPVWSRVVSGLPGGKVVEVDFVDVAPESLGPYGWHVPFRVQWTYGREQAHLYLGPEGDLLFYFLSW